MTKRQVLESQVQLDDSGQILIPTEMRKAMKLKPGDRLFLHYENASIQVRTRMQRIARAQALVRRYIPREVSLVEGFIAERREEARRELEKGN
jgi:AbrB family looped-hinge helix DNA binding protein